MMKILDFKTVSPLFEMERDGEKPFTCRKVEVRDPRFRALPQWQPQYDWAVRITNPATGGSFIRKMVSVDYVRYVDWKIAQDPERMFWERLRVVYDWRMIMLGEEIDIE